MKREKIIISIIAFISVFLIGIKVEALCTSKKFSNLKMTAYKTEVSYELKFDNNHNAYFELTVNNVDSSLLVKFNGQLYKPENGTVKIPSRVSGGITYEIKLYGGYDTGCKEEYLYTKKITLPKYNKYSEREECIEYEEFVMCNKWYAKEIVNDEAFEEALNEYKNSLIVIEPEKEEEVHKNIIENIIDFYTEHIVITLPITIVICLFVVYKVVVIIIRRKNRVKLN